MTRRVLVVAVARWRRQISSAREWKWVMSEADRENWNERHGEAVGVGAPSAFLTSLDTLLPRTGRALDVAGGRGRNALWLARRGLAVTLLDVSDVALFMAGDEARSAGLNLEMLRVDLGPSARVPPGPWDLIASFYFLNRPLFAQYSEALAPGGWVVVAHPTLRNLARHSRPGPNHLLAEGELLGLVTGLDVVSYEEAWFDEGHHEARLVARRR